MSATLRKPVVYTLVALALATFAFLISVDPYFYSTRPREARGDAIYQTRVKGIAGVADVYLTRAETQLRSNIIWLHCAYGLLFLTAAALNTRWKVIPNAHDDMPKKFY